MTPPYPTSQSLRSFGRCGLGFLSRALPRLRRQPIGWLIAAAALCGSHGASAQIEIRSVTAAAQASADVVRVELSAPLAALPAGFVTQSPPRIAIDLPGVSNAMGKGVVDVGQGNVRSVVVAEGSDRARLVVNLRQAAVYRTTLEGSALLIVVDRAAGAGSADAPPATAGAASAAPASSPSVTASISATTAAAPAAAPAAAEPAAAKAAAAPTGASSASRTPAASATAFSAAGSDRTQPLRDIDFRRGADGAGRVLVNLPSDQVGIDIRQQGQNLVIEFQRAILPEALRRRLDVTDFGTPVQSIVASQSQDRARLVVEPRGAWEYSAYQTDTQFVLEVRPVRVDPDKLVPGTGYKGEKLSLNFQKIDVRALLQVVADFTSFNVVTSDAVKGDVTLRLKDVPWDQALDIILESNGLGVRKNGNVLLVAPKKELFERDQSELEAKRKVTELEPLRTQSFQLNYAKAEEIARALNGVSVGGGAAPGAAAPGAAPPGATPGGASPGGAAQGAIAPARILSPRGSVIFETRTNQLFVTDIPSHLEKVQALIARIDIPVRQVLIEARIVEADDSFGRALGVKLGGNDLRGVQGGVPGYRIGGGNNIMFGNSFAAVGAQTNQGGTAPDFNNSAFVNLPADVSRLGGGTAATFALSLFSAGANRFLNLELSALEAEGKGKIVSSPRVVTADKIKALIEQGEELPYQQATSSGATSVAFRKANLKLEVTPQITPEGNVILDVDVNKDSVGRSTPGGFAIDTKHVKTQVLVENGGTVVIGGIFIQTEKEDTSKVPLLGDMPMVGHLFKNRTRTVAKTELMIFITPRVMGEQAVVR